MAKKKKKSKLQKKIEDVSSRLWRNKSDKAWRELAFKEGGGVCAICGAKDFVQAHHLLPRQLSLYRHDLRNVVLLCSKDHKYSFLLSAHKNPIRFVLWLQKHKPEQWNWLAVTFDPDTGVDLKSDKMNYKEIYLALQKKLDDYKNSDPNLSKELTEIK